MSGGRCLQVAVTSGPRATTWPMPLGDKPSHGARELTNKVRQRPLRRPHDSRRRSPHPRRPVAAEITAVALAGHHQLSGAPVDVVDRQGRHLATARPQPRQHRQDRDFAASGAGPPITTLQHPRDLIHGDRAHHTAVRQPEASLAVGVRCRTSVTPSSTPPPCWPTAMSSPPPNSPPDRCRCRQTGVAQSRPADDHDQFRTAPGDTGSGRHVPRHRSASGHPRHPAERRR